MGYRKQICYPYGVQKTLFFCMFGSEFTVINRAEIECFLHPCGQEYFFKNGINVAFYAAFIYISLHIV